MAILSTFDPKYRKNLIQKNIDEFWIDNVVLIKKSWFFFVNVVVVPFLIILAILIFLMIWLSKIVDIESLFYMILAGLFFVIFLLCVFQIIQSSLAFFMWFLLFTPKSFIKYKQKWFFHNDLRTIDLHHVKSVHVEKSWLYESLAWLWSLVIATDGIEWTKDGSHSGNIRFKYVKHPEKKSVNIEYLLNNLNYN